MSDFDKGVAEGLRQAAEIALNYDIWRTSSKSMYEAIAGAILAAIPPHSAPPHGR